MDTEEGVEVVWNEVQISEKKSSKVQLVGSHLVCYNFFCGIVNSFKTVHSYSFHELITFEFYFCLKCFVVTSFQFYHKLLGSLRVNEEFLMLCLFANSPID